MKSFLSLNCNMCFKLIVPTFATLANKEPLHIPVLLEETLNGLKIKNDSLILDLTFGSGGHTKEILNRHSQCHVVALDRDELAFNIAREMSQQHKYKGRLTPLLGKFSEAYELLKEAGFEKNFTHFLLDAGCSSMQFDEAQRGFSISKDGPLDMRMDGNRYPNHITAADVVNNLDAENLSLILCKYGDENKSKEIVQSIIENRPIYTTKQLAEAVGYAFSFSSPMIRTDSLGRRCHAATKTFLALRIYVNDEMNELYKGVKLAEKYLNDEGRFAAITFNPLEDKIVKKSLTELNLSQPSFKSLRDKARTPSNINPAWRAYKKKIFMPTGEEILNNRRSRSAKLRIAIRYKAQ